MYSQVLLFLLIKYDLSVCIYVYQSLSDLVNACLCGSVICISLCIHMFVCGVEFTSTYTWLVQNVTNHGPWFSKPLEDKVIGINHSQRERKRIIMAQQFHEISLNGFTEGKFCLCLGLSDLVT